MGAKPSERERERDASSTKQREECREQQSILTFIQKPYHTSTKITILNTNNDARERKSKLARANLLIYYTVDDAVACC